MTASRGQRTDLLQSDGFRTPETTPYSRCADLQTNFDESLLSQLLAVCAKTEGRAAIKLQRQVEEQRLLREVPIYRVKLSTYFVPTEEADDSRRRLHLKHGPSRPLSSLHRRQSHSLP